MYTQIFFVTSVRGMVLPPQIAANAGLNVFGAKIPTPFFFMAAAFFFPVADCAFLPAFFFSAFSVAFVAFVMVVFEEDRFCPLRRLAEKKALEVLCTRCIGLQLV